MRHGELVTTRRRGKVPTLLKKRLWHRCLAVNFVKSLEAPFYRTPPVAASESHIKYPNSFD